MEQFAGYPLARETKRLLHWELPFHTRIMMVSEQERSIGDKNRLPSHLDARSGSLNDSEAPHKEPGWKLLDRQDGLGKTLQGEAATPSPSGFHSPQTQMGRTLRRIQCGKATFSLSFLREVSSQLSIEQRGVRDIDQRKPASTSGTGFATTKSKKTQTLLPLEK